MSVLPSDRLERAQAVAARLARCPEVSAVAIAGSQTAGLSDARSDLDLYVYGDTPIPVEVRRQIAQEFSAPGARIEIDLPFWGPEDGWKDRVSGLSVELIFWSRSWIEEQIERSLGRHEAGMGYSTSLWYTVWNSQVLYDREGWFARLQQRAASPYPDALRRAIVALNYPVLRAVKSSYRQQIELAILRHDRISINHRLTALLVSYFDILFAVNRVPNPGEKRLVAQVKRLCPRQPEGWETHIEALLSGIGEAWEQQRTLDHVDALLDGLDELLRAEGLLPPAG